MKSQASPMPKPRSHHGKDQRSTKPWAKPKINNTMGKSTEPPYQHRNQRATVTGQNRRAKISWTRPKIHHTEDLWAKTKIQNGQNPKKSDVRCFYTQCQKPDITRKQ